jgi:chloramphenicol 3-O-phosphotransferase
MTQQENEYFDAKYDDSVDTSESHMKEVQKEMETESNF